MDISVEKTIKALSDNNINACFVQSCEEAIDIAKSLIKKGDVISHGGSVTLKEAGFTELFKNGDYNYLDRSAPGLTDEDIEEIYRKTYYADAFFSSANAITENGEIYNVDGHSNRVSALLFGPKKVIFIVGINKLTKDITAAARRVKEVAAPKNCVRLSKDTYCRKTGKCVTLNNENSDFCSGCTSEDRICANYTVMGRQQLIGRVNVIIINKNLGF